LSRRKRRKNKYEAEVEEEIVSDDETPPRKKKKRKKKRYILKTFLTLLFLVGLYFFATSSIFTIDSVQVKGNVHFSQEDIIKISGVKVGKGEFKMSMIKADGKLEKQGYIKSAKIRRKLPNKVIITIKERTEKFGVSVKNEFALLDYSGMVLDVTAELPKVTIIEGLTVVLSKPDSELKVKQPVMYESLIKFMQTVENNDLFFKRIVVSELETKAYITDTFLCKGSVDIMNAEILSLKNIIVDLMSQKITHGTIIMTDNGTCTFTPEVE
jgi:cell division protein FtsQ